MQSQQTEYIGSYYFDQNSKLDPSEDGARYHVRIHRLTGKVDRHDSNLPISEPFLRAWVAESELPLIKKWVQEIGLELKQITPPEPMSFFGGFGNVKRDGE